MKNDECRMMNGDSHPSRRNCFLHSSFFILHFVASGVRLLLISLVCLYRWALSPAKTFLGGPLAQCRFTPSCSEYALESLKAHGAISGSWLALNRICRCHPWGDCGHDPVPPAKNGVRSAECGVVQAQ